VKAITGILLVILLVGTVAAYQLLPFPVEGAWATDEAGFSGQMSSWLQSSFLKAQLPNLATLRKLDPHLAEATLERFFPFTLGVNCTYYPVLWNLREGTRNWDLLSSGDLVPSTRDATVTITLPVEPISQNTSRFLIAFITALKAQQLTDQVNELAVEANDRIIIGLTDGMHLFFLADTTIYERHLPSLKLYLGKARQEGKKELHFEFNDVVG
jgi:hypothetical protein